MSCGDHIAIWDKFQSSTKEDSLISWINSFSLKLPINVIQCEFASESSLLIMLGENDRFLRIWRFSHGISKDYYNAAREYSLEYLKHPSIIKSFHIKPIEKGLKHPIIIFSSCADNSIRIYRQKQKSGIHFDLLCVIIGEEASVFNFLNPLSPPKKHNSKSHCFFSCSEEKKQDDTSYFIQITTSGKLKIHEIRVSYI